MVESSKSKAVGKLALQRSLLTELRDQDGQLCHGRFQAWRKDNPRGVFLNLSSRGKANAHGAACLHLGDTEWQAGEMGLNSLTKKRKVLAADEASLIGWAAGNGVLVSVCKDCQRQGLVLESYSKEIAEGGGSQREISDSDVSEAMEGYSREASYMVSSRNAALRTKALEEAKGVCEACGVDFSTLANGLGRRVLQVHHREQLALRDTPSVTKLADLAVLCANCHSMVHADVRKALDVSVLRAMLSRAGR